MLPQLSKLLTIPRTHALTDTSFRLSTPVYGNQIIATAGDRLQIDAGLDRWDRNLGVYIGRFGLIFYLKNLNQLCRFMKSKNQIKPYKVDFFDFGFSRFFRGLLVFSVF